MKHSHSHSEKYNLDLENKNKYDLENEYKKSEHEDTYKTKRITKQSIISKENECPHCKISFKYLNKHEWRCKSKNIKTIINSTGRWSFNKNSLLLKICYTIRPNERGYRQRKLGFIQILMSKVYLTKSDIY